MDFLKALTITADLAFIATLWYFASNLRWEYEADRAGLIGFSAMILALILNIGMVFFARY